MAGVRRAARDAALIDGQLAPPARRATSSTSTSSTAPSLRGILDLGVAYKNGRRDRPLAGKTLAMIFEKPSTRTRVSFEVAMRQLGGDTIFLGTADSQLGRGETVADTARVLSRYVDAIMIRTNQPQKLDELARYATVPVINGLTDASHPCQIMADVMTLQEKKGRSPTRSWPGAATATMSPRAGSTPRCALALTCGSPAPRSWAAAAPARLGAARGRPRQPDASPTRPSPAPIASSPTPGCRWGRRRASTATICSPHTGSTKR